ncbi:MAG: tautomerase family protein [Burkholderiales bacterium]|nr:tautomerase family protein [Burkholderiales bacterium]
MPLVRISLNRASTASLRQIGDAVHQAMVETIGIPEKDRFQVFDLHESQELIFDETFYDVRRSPGFLVVQITLAKGRTVEVKQNLYTRMAALLEERANVRPADVFVSLLEVGPADFSLGNGKAQFAESLPPHLVALQTQTS